jgi:hypothetical protein
MTEPTRNVFYTSGRDVYCWAEQQSSVMLKAVTPHGDPVELTAIEARELAAELMRLAELIER